MKLRPAAQGACHLALAFAAVALAGTAIAEEAATVRPPLLAVPAAPATTALQAAIDPDTGLLRPPTTGERIHLATLAREASAGMRRAVAASQMTVHADGTVSLALDPSLHSLATATLVADGSVHFACGDAGHAHPTTVTAPAAEDR